MQVFEVALLIVLAVTFYFVIPVGLLTLRDRWEESRSRHEIANEKREHPERFPGTPEFAARYDSPEFDELENHFGIPLPQSYRDLFGNKTIIRREDFRLIPPGQTIKGDWVDISYFVPPDLLGQRREWEALEEYWGANQSHWLFVANDFDGYWCFLDMSQASADDAPVYRLDWYSESPELIASGLRELLSWKVGPIIWDDIA